MRSVNESVARYFHMQILLKAEPIAIAQLARTIGCTYESARRWMNAFLEAGAIEFKGYGIKSHRGIAPSLYGWKS